MNSVDQSDSLPPDVVEMLVKAGWYPGRIVPTSSFIPDGFVPFPKAESVLREFGGLHFGLCGPGVDFARGDVEMDPRLAVHLKAELDNYEQSLCKRLFPLGEAYRGDLYIIIQE